MNIMPYRPMGMSKWVDDLFENFLNRPLSGFDSREVMFSQPSVNVREEATEFIVEVAAPGLTKEDFHLEMENGYLRISAEKTQEDEQQEAGKYFRREFNFTQFQRSFQLPDTIDQEGIAARYDNGILLIHLPKVEAAKKEPVKKIEIQ
ncbi:MAG: Hsp20/alpha crystallin family protein [Saprospirales bacterium]|nr:Hsp20/alpha crystallin family protein [Saprospirales bacterium]